MWLLVRRAIELPPMPLFVANPLFIKSPTYYKHILAKIVTNLKILLSELGRTDENVETALERVREYGVTQSMDDYIWSEEEEEESTPF